ncbi:hypothetical protein Agub_g11882 [Astrephomene gubernaculifera]|uniref:Uncharacterized protein n=1 Tax=Astrephomene gubernaculifera TaxID=47775 RepID=A0AAD3E1M5_9CHLO|nr:hypothetical protein Agub_g11882 [Astrephomene gubernaculifera]
MLIEYRASSQQSGGSAKRVGMKPMPCGCGSRGNLQAAVAVLLHNVECNGALLELNRPKRRKVASTPGIASVTEGFRHSQTGSGAAQESLDGAAVQMESGDGVSNASPSPANFADCITAAWARGGRVRWRPEDVQVLLAHLASLPPGGRTLATRRAMEKLGIAHLPDPDHKLFNAINLKMCIIRNKLAHGRDPLAGDTAPRAPHGTYNFRAWFEQAFLALPNHEGTVAEVAAILDADPEISRKLDKRPEPRYQDTAMWQLQLMRLASRYGRYPEIVNTGRKRGRSTIYRYDEEVARQLGERGKAPKGPKRRVAHMGKRGDAN